MVRLPERLGGNAVHKYIIPYMTFKKCKKCTQSFHAYNTYNIVYNCFLKTT